MSSSTNKPIQAKPRINAVAQYLMALAAVIGCYSLYSKYAVPVLEGPPNIIPKRTFVAYEDLPPAREQRTHLIPFLPANAWEIDDCQTLLTESGTILFKEFQEQPDGSLTVAPFTLFSGLETKFTKKDESGEFGKPKMPTVLRCMQGANLKFDKPMNEVYAGNASLDSARLIGNVDIYRPPSGPKADDAMQVLTSNVQIDKKRIYTIENVQFAFGRNAGSGRNLMLDLSHENGPKNDFSNIDGVRRMELAFLHQLRIEPTETSNTFAPKQNQSNESDPKKLFSNSKSPIEVSCQGAFVFDFEAKIASFKKDVIARLDDAYQDSIECDELILNFEEKPSESLGSSNIAYQSNLKEKKLVGDLQLTRLVAKGAPAVMTSRSKSAKLTGQFLSYDVATDRIVGQCTPESNLAVTVVSPEYQIVSKKLKYIVPKDKSLGPIEAIGPGRLLKLAKDEDKELFVSWEGSLTTSDVPEQPNVKNITLSGQTNIRFGNRTRATADSFDLQVRQIPKSNLNSETQDTAWTYEPIKIIGRGNVEIDSPKFAGKAKTLTATWPTEFEPGNIATRPHQVGYRGTLQVQSDQQPYFQSESTAFPGQLGATRIPAEVAANNQGLGGQTTTRSAPSNSDRLQKIRNEFVEQATLTQTIPPARKKGPNKINFRGDDVEVVLHGSGKATEILDLTIAGNVEVSQLKPVDNRTNENNGKALTLTGDRLRLIPQTENSYRAVVTQSRGSRRLARVVAQDFELTGNQINLDQQANKVWVQGAGSMKLASTSLEQSDQSAANVRTPGSPNKPQDLDVSWEGGMIFDGAKIYFERKVVMKAVQATKSGRSITESASEGLRVELESAVDFGNLSKDKKIGKAKIKDLLLVSVIEESKRVFKLASNKSQAQPDPKFVVLQNRMFDLYGKLVEKQNIVVPSATVNAQNGNLLAKGPGSVSTHRDGTISSTENPFSKLAQNKTRGLSFVQINFDGDLRIDSNERTMKVNGNVRTIYAPIGSWNQTLNPDEARRIAPAGSVNLTCQQLEMAQWKPRGQAKADSEMIAIGNIHIFSPTFESTADRVSYKRSTDTLIIEGTPRNEANLWFKQSLNDKNPTKMTAEKISYRIKDQRARAEAVKNMDISSR